MDDITDIHDLYNAGWDAEENRLKRHQIEADLTWIYLDLLFEISAEPSIVASSRHILYVGQKPGA